MKLNSISGTTFKVKDLQKSAAFYESLGMRLGKRDNSHVTCYVNWYGVDLVADSANADPKAVYRGLRPEETTKANDPSVRPL